MIINNKYLNSKPKYELPEGVQIGEYRRGGNVEPSFVPDISINSYGTIGIRGYKETSKQVCIKTSDDGVLSYLKEYDWCSKYNSGNSIVCAGKLNSWQVKKIISEYYSSIK